MRKWKLLAYLFTAFFIINLVALPFSTNVTIWDFINLIAIGFSLIPMYGYAYKIAIGNKFTAIIIFIYNAICATAATWLFILIVKSAFSVTSLAIYMFAEMFILVCMYPQFKYAFKSEILWVKNT